MNAIWSLHRDRFIADASLAQQPNLPELLIINGLVLFGSGYRHGQS
jgi:hypothetical protein